MIFDGKAFAQDLISKLPHKKAKLAIFLSEDNISGARYVKIKTEVAKRLGVEVEVTMTNSQIPMNIQVSNFKSQIEKLNNDESVTGIMIQLPFPNSEELIKLIDPEKDVDGLRNDSLFLPAVVLAVKKILESRIQHLGSMCIVGSKGFVGKNLMKLYPSAIGMDKEDFNPEILRTADVVISAVGSPSLITCDMVKSGVIIIDVGFPHGDVEEKVREKASFFTPVPGGIGPVTVVCLFENLLYGRHDQSSGIKPPR